MAQIRVGVIGVSRGMSFARGAQHAGMELVALCDTWEERLREAGSQLGVATYTEYDRFLEHDMDAVILANYFHQHAPFAIKALDAGFHVMSETSACKTLGEGVALARAVERCGKIYMFAENYAFFSYVQEMRRLYQAGEIGEVRYAEGEYNHPFHARGYSGLAPGINHWRNHLPPTYYCTHAMSPILYVTGTRPQSVNALAIAASPLDRENLHVIRGDPGFVTICRMDNGAAARLMGLKMRGESIWYRFHGTRGLMENLRSHGESNKLRIVHEEWDRREGDVAEKVYTPDFPIHAEQARKAGHGGGDFFTNFFFAEAIRNNEQPFLDVYRGLDMTLVGIQSWRSCLASGTPFEIPDFRQESVRQRYEDDDWSPFPEDRRPGQPWPSLQGDNIPSPEALAAARQVWDEMGYEGE
ncbi:MAG: Gfo/Idh/MocA family protein [Armatimonadota bacterium]